MEGGSTGGKKDMGREERAIHVMANIHSRIGRK